MDTTILIAKRVTMTDDEYNAAKRALLPVRIQPDIAEFFRRNKFKEMPMDDDIRAKLQVGIGKVLEEPINLLAWYVSGNTTAFVMEEFCLVGGGIDLEDTEGNAEFFNRLRAGYHMLNMMGLKLFFNIKVARSAEELKELHMAALDLCEIQDRLRDAIVGEYTQER